MNATLLSQLREAPETLGAFALLVRSVDACVPLLEIYAGDMMDVRSLDEIPIPPSDQLGHSAIAVIPYRQLAERGYACVNDGEPLRVLRIIREQTVMLDEALRHWPESKICIDGGKFDIEDAAYAHKVNRIIAEEIGGGEGSNFVLKRTFQAQLIGYSLDAALAAFRRLALQEVGAYWTFLIYTGDRTWIGASPECHISLRAGTATMNPISGTYRYPPTGPTLDGIMRFLANQKENEELCMVVDEELKMMAGFCTHGGKLIGPRLKEMSRLAHTEYMIEGKTNADPRTILRETLFAPAVTGSPIENACRVIAKYEPEGRGYYAGVLALFGRDSDNRPELDSSILIRTADIDRSGSLRVSVGATIVRHSDPEFEAAETRTKALAVLNALGYDSSPKFSRDPSVIAALRKRNDGISLFWQSDAEHRSHIIEGLSGRKLLIIDAEDSFTAMLGHQLCSMGLEISIARCDDPRVRSGDWDLAVFGPGPGDPTNFGDPRIRALRQAISDSIKRQKTFLAVCLSHQLVCLELGLELVRRRHPNQGVQQQIDYFGSLERVGFYNTFNAVHHSDALQLAGKQVEVCRDVNSNEVHALRGSGFSSIQFHAESVLTENGIDIIARALLDAISSTSHPVHAD